ncbi:MAG: heavy-metal-associated domain-containing protein [Prevotella sp.]|nr:heavy-metal-associated domain-containing protein [Prevotella sp.]MCM1074555.1 heavy-metal-associated domain-containing protein [Ruminococcus sp.]
MKAKLLIAALLLGSASLFAKDIKTVIFTPDPPMSCQNCENKIKGNLRFEKGVKEIETNLKTQQITIKYDADKTDPANLGKALKKLGYTTTEAKTPAKHVKNCDGKSGCHKKSK